MATTLRPAVARRAPEAVARFERGMDLLQEGALLVADALAEIHRVAAFRLESCSSVYEWAERRNLSAAMARTLVSLHHAMEHSKPLAEKVERREVTLDAAAALEKIVRNPALSRPGGDWIKFAGTRDVVKKVRRRVAPTKARRYTCREAGRVLLIRGRPQGAALQGREGPGPRQARQAQDARHDWRD